MKKSLDSYLHELTPAKRRSVERRAAELIAEEMGLQELRKAIRKSQEQLAKTLNVKQGEVSKIEHRTDMYVSTLRNYIEGLGGKLEITASFPDRNPIRITQFELERNSENLAI
jgi:transcriptional regulator with XRE-family HTH domain